MTRHIWGVWNLKERKESRVPQSMTLDSECILGWECDVRVFSFEYRIAFTTKDSENPRDLLSIFDCLLLASSGLVSFFPEKSWVSLEHDSIYICFPYLSVYRDGVRQTSLVREMVEQIPLKSRKKMEKERENDDPKRRMVEERRLVNICLGFLYSPLHLLF